MKKLIFSLIFLCFLKNIFSLEYMLQPTNTYVLTSITKEDFDQLQSSGALNNCDCYVNFNNGIGHLTINQKQNNQNLFINSNDIIELGSWEKNTRLLQEIKNVQNGKVDPNIKYVHVKIDGYIYAIPSIALSQDQNFSIKDNLSSTTQEQNQNYTSLKSEQQLQYFLGKDRREREASWEANRYLNNEQIKQNAYEEFIIKQAQFKKQFPTEDLYNENVKEYSEMINDDIIVPRIDLRTKQEQIQYRRERNNELSTALTYYELKNSSRNDPIDILFEKYGSFNNFPKSRIARFVLWLDNNYLINSLSYETIFNLFTDFESYLDINHQNFLKKFVCYERFILGFELQFKLNPSFKTNLESLPNGKKIFNYINQEISRIKNKNSYPMQLQNDAQANLKKIADNERNKILSQINENLINNDELFEIDFSTICIFSSENIDKFYSNLINKYGFNPNNIRQILDVLTNFNFYKTKENIEKLKKLPGFEKFILSIDAYIQVNNEFRNRFLKQDQDVLKFIQTEAQQVRTAEEKKLKEALKTSQPLSNDIQNLASQFKEDQKTSKNLGITLQRKSGCIGTLKDTNLYEKTYELLPETKKHLQALGIDIAKFETYKGTFVQQQIHYEVITQMNRATILAKNPEEIFKNIAKKASDISLIGLSCNQDKQYKQAYFFMDVVENLLAQYEGVCQRLDKLDENSRKLFDFPNETLKEWGNEYKNSAISMAKAISFCVLNLPDYSEWGIGKTEAEKIKAVEQLGKEITEAYNHIAKEFAGMSTIELNRKIGYVLTDLIFSGVKTKVAGKVVTMSGKAIRASAQRGAQICKELGQAGKEAAELAGKALEKGIEATGHALDMAKKELKLVTTEGEIVKFVENTLMQNNQLFSSAVNSTKKVILKAKNGLEIKGWTKHGIDRAIGNTYERLGVKPHAIIDALRNPLKISEIEVDKLGRKAQKFYGKTARVVVNPDNGLIISVNPLSTKKIQSKL